MTETVDRHVRQEVAEVLVRYAVAIDRRDWELFRTCFTADCEVDYGVIGNWHGVEALTTWMRDTHAPCGHTMHRITNEWATPDGDGMTARSYVDALVMSGDNESGTEAIGFYDDDLVRTDEGWKITRRRFTMVLLRLVPDGTPISLDGRDGG